MGYSSGQSQCLSVELTPGAWAGASGSAAEFSGGCTLVGTGDYLAGQSFDRGFIDFVNLPPGGQIQARISNLSGSDSVTASMTAGIFIRENADLNANGGVLWIMGKSGNLYESADRSGNGNLEVQTSGSASLPYWLRLREWEGILYPSVSEDGNAWTNLTPYDMSSDFGSAISLDYGLAVWSGSDNKPATAVFDDLCVVSNPSFTPTPSSGGFVWPNPFTPAVSPNQMAHFRLPSTHGAGNLLIVDLRRRLVRSENFIQGSDIEWDGKDQSGRIVSSGVYVFLLESDRTVHRGTVTVMR